MDSSSFSSLDLFLTKDIYISHVLCMLFKVHHVKHVLYLYPHMDFHFRVVLTYRLEYQMVFITESHLSFWRSLFWIYELSYANLNFLSLIGNNKSISFLKLLLDFWEQYFLQIEVSKSYSYKAKLLSVKAIDSKR